MTCKGIAGWLAVTLTTGTDSGAAFTGGSGNDTFNAPVGLVWDTGTAAMVEVDSMQSVDVLDGGAGTNTLNFTTAGTVALPTLKNIQVINGESLAGLTINTSAVAGVTNLNITKAAAAVSATGAATTDINVTMKSAADDVSALGGNNVTVKVTDVAGDSSAKKVTVGTGGTAPKGDVVVEVAAKAATDGTDIKLNAIDITGGKTISVTQTVGSASGLAAGETAPDHTQGDVTIVAGATTTTVTVKQDLAATKNDAVAAVAGVNEVVSVKFVGLAAGETMELTDGVNTLVFTAAKTLSASQVAAAFANLSANAAVPTGGTADSDTQGSQTAANGVFSGELTDWNSAAAVGDTVIFTAATAGTTGLADAGGSKSATVTITTDAVTEVDAEAAVVGVVVGDVDITGGAALATVTVDSYKTGSEIQGGTNNALATVNLSNGADFDIASAAATLALNLTNVTGAVDVQAGTTTLNATVTTNSTTAATLESASATTVSVSGTGRVAGTTAAGGLTAATAINTTGMTAGEATFTVANGTATTYTGGAAVDNVTVTNSNVAITKAIDLGAGDDTLTLNGATVVPTATLKGGEGADTLSISAVRAAALDGDTLFKAKLDSFERLTINTAGTSVSAPQTPFFPDSLGRDQMLGLQIPGQEGLEVFDSGRGR